jgi:hypothetical protein
MHPIKNVTQYRTTFHTPTLNQVHDIIGDNPQELEQAVRNACGGTKLRFDADSSENTIQIWSQDGQYLGQIVQYELPESASVQVLVNQRKQVQRAA